MRNYFFKNILFRFKKIGLKNGICDGKTVRAVIRSLEVIGEAASKISDDFQRDNPEIPWRQIVGMRNRLIHVYFDIDYKVVWQTMKSNIPSLLKMLEGLVRD
jgi:uncharacterized protein with HEPN domain